MPFDASYTPPQAPAGLLTLQDVQAKQAQIDASKQQTELNLKNAVLQGQLGQQEVQKNTLDLQEKQRQIDQTRAVNDAYRNALTIGPDGAASIDSGKLTKALSSGGHGSQIPGILEGVTKYQQANAALAKTNGEVKVQEADAAGAMGNALKAAGDDPHLFLTMAQHEVNMKTVDGAAMQPLMQKVAQSMVDDPTGAAAKTLVGQIRTQLVAASGEQQKQIAAQTTADARKQAAETGAAKQGNEAPGQIADATQKQVTALAPQLESAFAKGGLPAVQEMLDGQPHIVAKRFANVTAAGGFDAAALNPEQATAATQAAANATETARHNRETEAEGRNRIFLEGRNANINAQKFAMEFGGNAVKGWSKQIADNPDTANAVPPALRTSVMQQFTANTGLPYPKPLTGTAVDQERAARNTLDKIPRIQQLLADPEISSRTGAILGHLGNAEQAVGTAVGLSDSASAKAQELRTLMRYTVMGEGKVLLGGRMPQQLMEKLESSSIKDTMDPNLAAGALKAMGGAADDVLNETFKQRFGSNAKRPAAAATPAAGGAPTVATQAQFDALPRGAVYLEDGKKYKKP